MRLKTICICFLSIIVMTGFTGCGNLTGKSDGKDGKGTEVTKTEPAKESFKSHTIRVYVPSENADGLVGKEVTFQAREGKEGVVALEVMRKAQKAAQMSLIPEGVKIQSVTIQDHLATVNFEPSIREKMVGGSTTERLLIESVVNTLTELPNVKSIKILVDGKEQSTLNGHYNISSPLTRVEKSILKK